MPIVLLVLAIVWGAGLFGAPALAAAPASTQSGDTALYDINRKIGELQRAGKHAEAVPLAETYVAMARERHGEEHPEYASAIAWLGFLYKDKGRYAEAEPLAKRALAINQKSPGPLPGPELTSRARS